MKTLNLDKIAERKRRTVSSEEALKDVNPFDWSDDVRNGRTKIIITAGKSEE